MGAGGATGAVWRGALEGGPGAGAMAPGWGLGDGAVRGRVGWGLAERGLAERGLAGLGEVAETPGEVFEVVAQGRHGFGGQVVALGEERVEKPQEERCEAIGGGAGCWGEHEQKENISGRGWQGARRGGAREGRRRRRSVTASL